MKLAQLAIFLALPLLSIFIALPLAAQTSKLPPPQTPIVGVANSSVTEPAPEPPPVLSVSQQTALRLLEQQKQTLQQQWQTLLQEENAVSSEFSQEHPGWHLDNRFTPVRDVPLTAKPRGK